MTEPWQAATARTLVLGGREVLYFGGCSYLGLAHDVRVRAAAAQALERYGLSSAAARTTSGTIDLHLAFEHELAQFCGAPACALFSDTALADLAVALARIAPGSRVFTDTDAHPCIVDAVRAAGAALERGDLGAAAAARARGCDVAFVDGTFPSAARTAPVESLVTAGFDLVVVDDAHGFGLLGERGAGAAERLDLARDDALLVVAFSKCLGAAGGAVLGSNAAIEAVRSTSPYANTTAPPAALVAAAREALRIVRDEPQRRERSLANATRLHAAVDAIDPGAPRALNFPVRALALGDERSSQLWRNALDASDIAVPVVRYPGGPGGAYLRFAVTSEHSGPDLDRLARTLERISASLPHERRNASG